MHPAADTTASPERSTTLRQVIVTAQRLRFRHPERYGTKGARKGGEGHVANGWQRAMRDAATLHRQELALQSPLQQVLHGERRPKASSVSLPKPRSVAIIRSLPLVRPLSLRGGDETTAVDDEQVVPVVRVKEEDETLVC